MFTSLLTGLSNAVAPQERGDANALVLTVRWIGAAAGTMVGGVIIHSGATPGQAPGAGPYATVFTVLVGVTLVGALACVFLLPGGPQQAQKPSHFRPHF
jgi:MFS family permease